MRPYFPALLLTSLLAGCASSATAKPTPVPTGQPVGAVATVPMSTPAPIKKPKGKAKSYHGPKLKKLPTVKPYTSYKAPTPIPARDFTAILHGKVTDAKTGSPVSGALVVVGQRPRHTTITNSFGQYRVTFPAGPDIVVQVTKHGFAGQLAMGRIKQHGSSTVDFKLAPTSVNKPAAPSPPMTFGTP
jgi:hypothetical protein